MKKQIITILAIIGLVAASYAADSVNESSGVVRNMQSTRWTVVKAGAEANTDSSGVINAVASLVLTQTISATPGVLGKVIFVPGAATDTLKLYNAPNTSSANVVASNLIFETVPNSPQLINSPTNPFNAGQAIVHEFRDGWSFTRGLVAYVTRSVSTTASKVYIGYDRTR